MFKGGTAVRKFRCDPRTFRRVSYDLDFTLSDPTAKARLPQLMSSTSPYMGCEFELVLGSHSRVRVDAPFLEAPLGVGFDAAQGQVLQRPDRVKVLRRPIHERLGGDWSFRVPVMTTEGQHAAAVAAAADDMATAASEPPPPPPQGAAVSLQQRPAVITEPAVSLAQPDPVVCGKRLGPRRFCRRMLRTKPCPQHPNSPGSRRIRRRKH